MELRFAKMQGLGNDFVVIDAVRQAVALDATQIRAMADRHFGIGFDQLLLVRPATRSDCDFRFEIFNADGSEVANCGNGVRCFARFVLDEGLSDRATLRVETLAGILQPELLTDGQVRVDMGEPDVRPSSLPLISAQTGPVHTLTLDGTSLEFIAVSMGNPHAVIRVAAVDEAPVHSLGARLEQHAIFPSRVNVGFLEVLDPHSGRLRVWERGVGETLACGTGACAAAVSGMLQGWFARRVSVSLPGGALDIAWDGPGHPVHMTGPARLSFRGSVDPAALSRNLP